MSWMKYWRPRTCYSVAIICPNCLLLRTNSAHLKITYITRQTIATRENFSYFHFTCFMIKYVKIMLIIYTCTVHMSERTSFGLIMSNLFVIASINFIFFPILHMYEFCPECNACQVTTYSWDNTWDMQLHMCIE